MSFADSVSNLAFSLSARSGDIAAPDSVAYFSSEPNERHGSSATKQEEPLNVPALLSTVSRLMNGLNNVNAIIETIGDDRVLKSVQRKKDSLQECHGEMEGHQGHHGRHTDPQTESVRAIWISEFELLQEAVEQDWKPAFSLLSEKTAELYNKELNEILVLIMEGLTKLRAGYRSRTTPSHLILEVDKASVKTKARNCRMTFRTYLEEHGFQEMSSGLFNKQSHGFLLQADSKRACQTSLSQALSYGGGVPRSLLFNASAEARKTVDRMRQAEQGLIDNSDIDVLRYLEQAFLTLLPSEVEKGAGVQSDVYDSASDFGS